MAYKVDDHERNLSPVAQIFESPYWNRLWIQQELILARQTIIHCQRDALEGKPTFRFQELAVSPDLYMRALSFSSISIITRVPGCKLSTRHLETCYMFLYSLGAQLHRPADNVYRLVGHMAP